MIFKPHATVAYGNTKQSFKDIWNYLKTKEKPEFDLKLDALFLMKKPRKHWKLHKVFKIK